MITQETIDKAKEQMAMYKDLANGMSKEDARMAALDTILEAVVKDNKGAYGCDNWDSRLDLSEARVIIEVLESLDSLTTIYKENHQMLLDEIKMIRANDISDNLQEENHNLRSFVGDIVAAGIVKITGVK